MQQFFVSISLFYFWEDSHLIRVLGIISVELTFNRIYSVKRKHAFVVCCRIIVNTFMAIYKTRNTGTGNGMREMQGTREH